MENSFDYITENYNRIYNEIEAAKAKYRKPSDHVDFMAVTKTVAPEAVNHAIHCGISLLGENRVQEYLSKRAFQENRGSYVAFSIFILTVKEKSCYNKKNECRNRHLSTLFLFFFVLL